MHIAMLAPPWIPIPAPAYGGIEEVIHLLCDGLVDRAHDVTLFAAPDSRSKAEVRGVLEAAHPAEIERARWEVDHVARAFAAVDDEAFDVVHDHTGHTALAMADPLTTPLVHTLHGPFDDDSRAFYAAHGEKGARRGAGGGSAGPAMRRRRPASRRGRRGRRARPTPRRP